MGASITILATEVDDPEQFATLSVSERRRRGNKKMFPSRSGRYPHRVLAQATGVDFSVAELEIQRDHENGGTIQTCVIWETNIDTVIPKLEAVVEANADATARALAAFIGETADQARISAALSSGDWPELDDAAAEAAAFAKQLLKLARFGALSAKGICLEYRGEYPLEGKGP